MRPNKLLQTFRNKSGTFLRAPFYGTFLYRNKSGTFLFSTAPFSHLFLLWLRQFLPLYQFTQILVAGRVSDDKMIHLGHDCPPD